MPTSFAISHSVSPTVNWRHKNMKQKYLTRKNNNGAPLENTDQVYTLQPPRSFVQPVIMTVFQANAWGFTIHAVIQDHSPGHIIRIIARIRFTRWTNCQDNCIQANDWGFVIHAVIQDHSPGHSFRNIARIRLQAIRITAFRPIIEVLWSMQSFRIIHLVTASGTLPGSGYKLSG